MLERSIESQHFSEPIVSFRVCYLQGTMLDTVDETNKRHDLCAQER